MKKLLLTSASTLALAGMAYGADMMPAFKAPPPPLATWTGFYVGIDGGAASAEEAAVHVDDEDAG